MFCVYLCCNAIVKLQVVNQAQRKKLSKNKAGISNWNEKIKVIEIILHLYFFFICMFSTVCFFLEIVVLLFDKYFLGNAFVCIECRTTHNGGREF